MASSASSSRTVPVTRSSPRSSVTVLPARTLRTQPTSPNGETSQYRSPSCTGTIGVVKTRPVVRPVTERSRMKLGPRPLRSARVRHRVGLALEPRRPVVLRVLIGRADRVHCGPPSGGPMKLYCNPAMRRSLPSATSVNETRVSEGVGVSPAKPTACWWRDDDRGATVAVHVDLVERELVVAQAVLEAAEPHRLVENEADRPDADEVVGEEVVDPTGVAGALGAGPGVEQLLDVGGHASDSLRGWARRRWRRVVRAGTAGWSTSCVGQVGAEPAVEFADRVEHPGECVAALGGEGHELGAPVLGVAGRGGRDRRSPCGAGGG